MSTDLTTRKIFKVISVAELAKLNRPVSIQSSNSSAYSWTLMAKPEFDKFRVTSNAHGYCKLNVLANGSDRVLVYDGDL